MPRETRLCAGTGAGAGAWLAARPELASHRIDTGFVEAQLDTLWPASTHATQDAADDPWCLRAPMAGRLFADPMYDDADVRRMEHDIDAIRTRFDHHR